MSEDSTAANRPVCPEYGCCISMTSDELRAHLEWDHNRRDHEIERLMRDV